ncbi:MAG TPA: acetylornithine deacetylase [Acidobacteriaceae bacterium]|nr:acetylornithine deacetylase [Acidobacteriaceae bacterium]
MDKLSPALLLDALIRIPSVSSMTNRPLIEFVEDALRERAWNIRELAYHDASGVEKINLLATPSWQKADDFAVDLAFVCHTDTVPYSAEWNEAIHSQVAGGVLHGCGACDVKGFLACLLAALLTADEPHVASTVALVLTAEEEVGCVGLRHLLKAGLLRPRHVVVGEPTSLRPARAGKGYGLAEIRVFGREAHSAHPAEGISAIYRAAKLIGKIEQYALSLQEAAVREETSIFDPPYTTFNVGTIEGGTAKNIIPGECKFLLEWRPLPGDPIGEIPDIVLRMVHDLRMHDPGFRYELIVLREQPGFETAAHSPLVRRWMEISGRDPIGVPFGTEAPLMSTVADDTIVLGPGDMRTAHSPRECVPLAELELCVEYLTALIENPLEPAR